MACSSYHYGQVVLNTVCNIVLLDFELLVFGHSIFLFWLICVYYSVADEDNH